jgi:hypothetical protein
MDETKQAPLPGWYDDKTGDGLVRWWNGRAWTEDYKKAPAPIVPVKQLPRWMPPALVVVGLVVIYALYQLAPVRAFFNF